MTQSDIINKNFSDLKTKKIDKADCVELPLIELPLADLPTSYISGLGMPSSKVIDLTIGATASIYTAPANGYFVAIGVGEANKHANFTFSINSDILSAKRASTVTGYSTVYIALMFPCKKGDVVRFNYGNMTFSYGSYTGLGLHFIYAEGEQ